jgi:Gluconate 2-dehydrogenase subunit 3
MPHRAPNQHGQTPGGKGRFPGFDVLDQIDHWDDVTAGVVLARLDPPVDFSFFTPEEQAIAGVLLDLLLGQTAEPRVPVLGLIDRRLALDETDGWRYEDMPDDPIAWRRSLAAIDEDAREQHGSPFHGLRSEEQSKLIQAVQDCSDEWHGMTASHVWSLWTRYACAAFYSHPWAWNEIGFGGPAYPRGYKALGEDKLEPWEVRDQSARGRA